MILPLLTYSCTIKTSFNNTQLAKFVSIERRAANIIGSGVTKCIKGTIDAQICSLTIKCLNKSFDHETLDNYFELMCHGKATRNNKCSLRLPPIKLESSKQSFYYGGAKLFNFMPEEERRSLLSPNIF